MWHHDMGWGGMWIGWLFWIIVIVVIVYLLVRFAGRNQQTTERGDTAIDILKKRYAQGEITKEQFEEMKKNVE